MQIAEASLPLPFMDDEPGLGVHRGGTAQLVGLNPSNATPGNAVKAALLSTIFNLRIGCEQLDQRGYPRKEIFLAGGITKTPDAGQILADVFNTAVTLLGSAEEGTAWGAAVMACYCHQKKGKADVGWSSFLEKLKAENSIRFEPDSDAVGKYQKSYLRYKALLATQSIVGAAINQEG